MILGTVTIDSQMVSTHRSSYLLSSITVVSVRRPFLGGAFLLAGGFGGFALAFADQLHPGAIGALLACCATCVVAGLAIGQLQLLSRDLCGSALADVAWGTYGHLNRMRRAIADAVRTGTPEVRR